jgi:hypothetical protein
VDTPLLLLLLLLMVVSSDELFRDRAIEENGASSATSGVPGRNVPSLARGGSAGVGAGKFFSTSSERAVPGCLEGDLQRAVRQRA